MADVIYRFDNIPWGGNHNVELEVDEMPDWSPIGQQMHENFLRSNNGKVWKYEWYRKDAVNLSFRGVGTAILATMGSIVREGVSFRWFEDINSGVTDGSGTGTMVYNAGAFEYQPLTPNLNDFDFSMEGFEL